MRSRNMVLVTVAAATLVLVAILGTVAYGTYAGVRDSQRRTADRAPVIGLPPGIAPERLAANSAAAPVAPGAEGPTVAIAQPAPGGFTPGGPPFAGAGGVAADGISAWGVAYREVSDPNAQADSALTRAAYQDAEKRAGDLAAATGNHLGKLVALADYATNQPYYRPCVQNYIPPQGAPVPQGKPVPAGTTGSGSSGSGTATGVAGPPVPAPCQGNSNHYIVTWVYVRHQL